MDNRARLHVKRRLEDKLRRALVVVEEEKERSKKAIMELQGKIELLEGENATLRVEMEQLQLSSKEATVGVVLRSKVRIREATDEERTVWDVDKEIEM